MAFGKAVDNSQFKAAEFTRHWGIGTFNVVAVNPNAKELEALGFGSNEEPQYIGEIDDEYGNRKYSVVEFYLKPTADLLIDKVFRHRIVLFKDVQSNRDETKYQVIDEYGRTAWGSKEVIQNKEIPMYASGPARITTNYRLAIRGEERLTDFIKTLLNINCEEYVNGAWVMKKDLSDCQARFDNLDAFFRGDFSLLKSLIKMAPNNAIKAILGIRHTDNGKTYETFFDRVFSPRTSDSYISSVINKEKEQGRLSNTIFYFSELTEYKIQASPSESLVKESSNQDMFANPFGAEPEKKESPVVVPAASSPAPSLDQYAQAPVAQPMMPEGIDTSDLPF